MTPEQKKELSEYVKWMFKDVFKFEDEWAWALTTLALFFIAVIMIFDWDPFYAKVVTTLFAIGAVTILYKAYEDELNE